MKTRLEKYRVLIIFSLLYIVFFVGHFIDVMDIDAAQYASISAEMSRTNSYLEVYHRGQDYLDKPPLLFWVSALAFKLFGFSAFTYHLFPVLFSFLGFYATYKLAKLFYGKEVGLLASIIYASTQAVFLMNHDIRTDNLLTTFTIFAIWQLVAYLQTNKIHFLVVGFIAVGIAMLAKGPIGMIAPGMVVFGHILFTRQWKNLFKLSWILGLVITAFILFPMCWGLYHQFDLQPDKMVPYVQEKGVSGLKFFFWTQSFGRITGESQWNNDPGMFFQLSSFLWSFLPWTLFAIVAYFKHTKQLFQSKFKISYDYPLLKEGFTWFGVTILFIALSLSSYQLPHYTYLIYPLIAIFTANYIHYQLKAEKVNRLFSLFLEYQKYLLSILWFGMVLFFIIIFPLPSMFLQVFFIFMQLFIGYWVVYKWSSINIVYSSFSTILVFNLVLNSYFYPNLTQYQSGSNAGKTIAELNYPEENVFCFLTAPYSIDLYSGYSIREIKEGALIASFPKGKYCIFTSQQGYDEFIDLQYTMKLIQKIPEYPITNLSLQFLNPRTRVKSVSYNYLVEITLN
jgi:4-amino-4-deoxy-L-arabinose transferase-like glycosyltransferase